MNFTRLILLTLLHRGTCNKVQLLEVCIPHILPEDAAQLYCQKGLTGKMTLTQQVMTGRRTKTDKAIWCLKKDGHIVIDDIGMITLTTQGAVKAQKYVQTVQTLPPSSSPPRPKTMCSNGHLLTSDNTSRRKHWKKIGTYTVCLTCRRLTYERRHEKDRLKKEITLEHL